MAFYEVEGLTEGTTAIWHDRDYTFSQLPEVLAGGLLLRGPVRIEPIGTVLTIRPGGLIYVLLDGSRDGGLKDNLQASGWSFTGLSAAFGDSNEVMDVLWHGGYEEVTTVLPATIGETVLAFVLPLALPCDASTLLENAVGLGDCSSELEVGGSCTNIPNAGKMCTASTCLGGIFTAGICAGVKHVRGDLSAISSSAPSTFFSLRHFNTSCFRRRTPS